MTEKAAYHAARLAGYYPYEAHVIVGLVKRLIANRPAPVLVVEPAIMTAPVQGALYANH